MSYEQISYFSQTYGLVFLVILFAAAIGYALWPKNKARFDAAAQIPFSEDKK
jgi:cytochrome c oxidase cbb3-type subunit 4